MKSTTRYGYNVSKLTMGTVQLGLNYSIQEKSSKPDLRESLEILKFATKAGINTLDTARTYGDAEQVIGNFFKKQPDQRITIVSKFKISDKNLQNFEQAKAEVNKSITTSLSMLQIKRIPICLFHKNKDQPMDLVMKIIPGILESLEEDGLIGIGGISVYQPGEVKYILEESTIKAIQAPMNIIDQRLKQSDLLQLMHSKGKLIFIRSVFLKGLFFMKPDQLPGNLIQTKPYLQKLKEIADEADMSVAKLAFSYVRDIKEISSIVFGAENVKQIQQNLEWFREQPLELSIQKKIEDNFKIVPDSVITPHLWNLTS